MSVAKVDHPPQGRQSYRARWLFPLNAEPIENGTIELDEGCIVAIHTLHEPEAEDLGNVAVIPGLVNAHTHLEFSDLDAPIGPANSFTDWIRAVVAHRQSSAGDAAARVQRGWKEAAQAGTTTLAEITTDDDSAGVFDETGPFTFSLRELIGFLPEQIDEQLEIARAHLAAGKRDTVTNAVYGISPHAPYSVHPELYHMLVTLAADEDALLAVHLAETADELQFLDQRTGPFADMLRGFGVWQDGTIESGTRPMDYLKPLENLNRALIVHGNYLSDEEIDFVVEHPNLTVVYCPRTHAYFGHSRHPYEELIARGARVAIGTDSRASNPDLSVFRELCFLYTHKPGLHPHTLLKLGTSRGAEALDPKSTASRLTPGGSADLAVVSLQSASESDPYQLLFNHRNRIVGTMLTGRWIYRADDSSGQ